MVEGGGSVGDHQTLITVLFEVVTVYLKMVTVHLKLITVQLKMFKSQYDRNAFWRNLSLFFPESP